MPRLYCFVRLSDPILTRPQLCQTEQYLSPLKTAAHPGSLARFPGTLNADVMRSFASVVAFPDLKIFVFSCRLNTFRADDDLTQAQYVRSSDR